MQTDHAWDEAKALRPQAARVPTLEAQVTDLQGRLNTALGGLPGAISVVPLDQMLPLGVLAGSRPLAV